MKLALALARRQLGRTGSNPAVGCVIVSDGRVVGQGATSDGGRPHAEAIALEQAGRLARGATVYVTLEPCAHKSIRGSTCAEILVEAGIQRLIGCIKDPDPRTAGRGFAWLEASGVVVQVGILADMACEQISDFIARLRA
jgi:diaminohydroxyphosphoribosylaminopyrimidine deaminase / 5-amino-6-(5-phosphoribosylamino)uracil reductase